MNRRNFFTCLILFISARVMAQSYQPSWESLDKRPIPQWYKDAKFGIIIHWGVYSVPGWSPKGQYAEWYQYFLQTNAFEGKVAAFHKKKFGEDFPYYQLPSFSTALFL